MSGPEDFRLDGAHPVVVYLHLGAPKTGTTYLQKVLWHNQERLAHDGVLYPAEPTGDHFRAALDLRGVRFLGFNDPSVPGSWQRSADQVGRWRGPAAVISHEMLAWASEDQARRAVESLRPAEVHVVYTARDLVRQIPAVWQESVKNRRVVPLPRYLRSLREPERPGPWGKTFWGAQDAVDVLRRWGAAVPPDRVHVITVPPPGAPPGLLWQRFAGVIGLDPARYDAEVGGANVSLGWAEVELLRRINQVVDKEMGGPTYERLFKRRLAETVLAGRAGAQRIALSPEWHAWAVRRSEDLVAGLREAGYPVAGDLDELVPRQPPDGGRGEPAHPGPDEVLDVAVETIVRLLTEQAPQVTHRRPSWHEIVHAGRSRAASLARGLRLRG